MNIETGGAFAFRMNAHRHQWNGSICSDVLGWNCGSDESFRIDYCERGIGRCFHMHTFDKSSPKILVPDNSVCQLLVDQPNILDNQILIFYGGRFNFQHGIAIGNTDDVIFGLYRVKKTYIEQTKGPRYLVIEPFPDGWAVFPANRVRMPNVRSIPGLSYIKHIRTNALQASVESALEAMNHPGNGENLSTDLQQRLQTVSSALPVWLDIAATSRSGYSPPVRLPAIKIVDNVTLEGPLDSKLKSLKIPTVSKVRFPVPIAAIGKHNGKPAIEEAKLAVFDKTAPGDESIVQAAEPVTAIDAMKSDGLDAAAMLVRLPEPQCASTLELQFDTRLTMDLRVAFATKPLVILTGAPGSGKSWIAGHILDDDERDRSVIVPVSSTWRGREDLLGYVNPVSGVFEPTEFTEFLLRAEAVWDAGDRRARLVIFEEFNLSQPEHWLSDFLVRLEYEPKNRIDRTISLGGSSIARHPGRKPTVFLVPCLSFVATLNNDHTVKPLSPRVLDRSALIEVVSNGRSALKRAGIEVDDEIAEMIEEVNGFLEPRGAAFSVRSARSLERALLIGKDVGLSTGQALDLVLAQEVLSRVHLQAGDPRDEQLVARLDTWVQQASCKDLLRCSERIADWRESLRAGRDVFQA